MPLSSKQEVMNSLNAAERSRAKKLELSERISYYGSGLVVMTGAFFLGLKFALAATAITVPGLLVGAIQGSPIRSPSALDAFSKIRDSHSRPLSSVGCLCEGMKVGLVKDGLYRHSVNFYKAVGSTVFIVGFGCLLAVGIKAMPTKSLREKARTRLTNYLQALGKIKPAP